MSERKDEILDLYYRSNSVQFKPHRIAAHQANPNLPLTPVYLHYPAEGKPGSEYLPRLRTLIGEEFHEMCELADPPIRPRYIIGLPVAGTLIADEHAKQYPDDYSDNLITVIKKVGPSGVEFVIPKGTYVEGEEAVADDDHITSAYNHLLFYKAASAGRLVVRHMLNAVDRLQGASAILAEVGVTLHSITTIDEMLEFGVQSGDATRAQANEQLEYRLANQF